MHRTYRGLLSSVLALIVLALVAMPALAREHDDDRGGDRDRGRGNDYEEQVRVNYLRTIDGNTIEVMLDRELTTVSLSSVAAPELSEGTAQAFGSAQFLAHLLESAKFVYVERAAGERRGSHNRLSAWVWITPQRESANTRILVQRLMVDSGNAIHLPDGYSGSYLDVLYELEPDQPQRKPRIDNNPYRQETGRVEIMDHDMQLHKDRNGSSNYSWQIDVSNSMQRSVWMDLRIELLDGNGFVIGNGYMQRQLVERGDSTFTNTSQLGARIADQVRSYTVYIEETS